MLRMTEQKNKRSLGPSDIFEQTAAQKMNRLLEEFLLYGKNTFLFL